MNTIASTRRNVLAAAIVILTALGAAFTTEAATVTWGAATNIAADTDVSTTGTLVDAFNMGGAGGPAVAATVNGVNFQAFNVPFPGVTTFTVGNYTLANASGILASGNTSDPLAPFSALSASYQALLGTEAGSGVGPVPITLTMAGLTVGQSYTFQFWANYSNISGNSGGVTATAGNSVGLDLNTTNAHGGLGQFAIGTFIADNASQQISFNAGIISPTFINAFQLRTTAAGPGTAVPEPGSALVGMMALGLCGAGFGRRR